MRDPVNPTGKTYCPVAIIKLILKTNSQISWCYNIVSSDALVLNRLASLADCLAQDKNVIL